MNSTSNSSSATPASARSLGRSSEILRSILTKNPGVETFTVERILASIGHDRPEASLMLFAIPAIVPVPGPRGIVSMPTSAIACQIAAGQKQVRLPAFVLKKTVTRKSLAVAIHAILPILEAAEKVVRPRWSWAGHPVSRRAIGMFVFLLAVAIAYPLFGFNALHALSIFVVSLGMAEQDGLAIVLGLVAGVCSLAILAASGLSVRAVRVNLVNALRSLGKKLGLDVVASFLDRHGYRRLASILRFEWSDLLMKWDPEKRAEERRKAMRQAARATRAGCAPVTKLGARRPSPPTRKRAA